MKLLHSATALGALLAITACTADSPVAVEEPVVALRSTSPATEPLPLLLCKSWADDANPAPNRSFAFTVAANGASSTVDVFVGECIDLGPYAPGTQVTITEIVPSGFRIATIWRVFRDVDDVAITTNPTSPSITFTVDGVRQVFFKNAVAETPPPGLAGCTPGFWRQDQHFPYWIGYRPGDAFSSVFGVTRAGTLLQNVRANGGGANALARHAVAALLNAASPEVQYPYSAAEVIAAVQSAFATGDFERVKDRLEQANELGCTVDKSRK